MAEPKKPSRAKPRAKAAAKTTKPAKAAAKKAAPPRPKRASPKPKAAPRRASRPKSSSFNIADLIDHPLVADLLAVGAMAAVAAIADHSVKTRTGEAGKGSSKAVKAAGKAAASAIGKRLLTEVDAVRKAGKAKEAKSGSS